jgi:hypothetical protein
MSGQMVSILEDATACQVIQAALAAAGLAFPATEAAPV